LEFETREDPRNDCDPTLPKEGIMPPEPVPDPLTMFPDSDIRFYIIQNIKDLSEAVVRGRNAGHWLEILVYRIHSIVTGVLGTIGGSGITIGWTDQDARLPGYVVGVLTLTSAVALEVYNQLKVEDQATQALKARDAFDQLSSNMGVELKKPEPNDALAELSKTSDTLLKTFYRVIPELAALPSEEAKKLEHEALAKARELVSKFNARWLARSVSKGGRSLT
jgi:hypothetical protein